jgi:hypothetical protein
VVRHHVDDRNSGGCERVGLAAADLQRAERRVSHHEWCAAEGADAVLTEGGNRFAETRERVIVEHQDAPRAERAATRRIDERQASLCVVPILVPVRQAKRGCLEHEDIAPVLVKCEAQELVRDHPAQRRR